MPNPSRRELLLLLTAFAGFISLGLPDAVLGVAWPSLRETFALPQSGLGGVLLGIGAGFLLSSFLAGRLVQALGVGVLLSVSGALVTLSLVGYALAGSWYVFLGCALVAGLGSGAIDAGLNAHAAHHFSTRHMNWLHACYGVGATLGPVVMSGVLDRGGSWRLGYAAIALLLLVMTVAFVWTRRRWDGLDAAGAGGPLRAVRLSAALQEPLVWFHVVLFFLYTGLEVTAGQWSFTLFTESRGVDVGTAGVWVGLYWACLAAGRVLFGFVVDRIGTDRLLRGSMLSALAGTVLLAVRGPAWLGFLGLALIGLALAPIYPCLMSRTPERLGAGLAMHAIGLQVCAAMIGAAALPGLAGVLAGAVGLEAIGPVMVAAALALGVLHEALLGRPSVALGPQEG